MQIELFYQHNFSRIKVVYRVDKRWIGYRNAMDRLTMSAYEPVKKKSFDQREIRTRYEPVIGCILVGITLVLVICR